MNFPLVGATSLKQRININIYKISLDTEIFDPKFTSKHKFAGDDKTRKYSDP
jgi:hypothetical protein